jgi:hypothetical protein
MARGVQEESLTRRVVVCRLSFCSVGGGNKFVFGRTYGIVQVVDRVL